MNLFMLSPPPMALHYLHEALKNRRRVYNAASTQVCSVGFAISCCVGSYILAGFGFFVLGFGDGLLVKLFIGASVDTEEVVAAASGAQHCCIFGKGDRMMHK